MQRPSSKVYSYVSIYFSHFTVTRSRYLVENDDAVWHRIGEAATGRVGWKLQRAGCPGQPARISATTIVSTDEQRDPAQAVMILDQQHNMVTLCGPHITEPGKQIRRRRHGRLLYPQDHVAGNKSAFIGSAARSDAGDH